MNISVAKKSDLVEVIFLLKVCSLELSSKGCLYWQFVIPKVLEDLDKKKVFMLRENEVCLGIITLDHTISEEYKKIAWQHNSSKALAIYRLIVHPNWENKNIKDELLKFAEEYAKDNGYESIRIDIFGDNLNTMDLFTHLNYMKAGEILLPYQSIPFVCYEKKV